VAILIYGYAVISPLDAADSAASGEEHDFMPYLPPEAIEAIGGSTSSQDDGAPGGTVDGTSIEAWSRPQQEDIYEELLEKLKRINLVQYSATLAFGTYYIILIGFFLYVPTHKRIKKEKMEEIRR